MSGPEDGKYQIVSSSFASSPIGVERSSQFVVPVITGGSDNIVRTFFFSFCTGYACAII